METFTSILVESLISGILVSGLIGYFLLRRDERIKNTIQEEFKKRDIFFNAQFNFKQRSVEELLGPVMMQLTRSSITLQAYRPNDAFQEAILKECNETVRDLLLKKGFLLPAELLPDAGEFIKHYDGWLQLYNDVRIVKNDKEAKLLFTFDFPRQAEQNFGKKYNEFRKELRIEEKLRQEVTAGI